MRAIGLFSAGLLVGGLLTQTGSAQDGSEVSSRRKNQTEKVKRL